MQGSSSTALRKYKFGFAVLGLLTLVLFVFVVIQGQATKADAATSEASQKVADKLESYITNKGSVPASLTAAGVTNAPDSVQYTKLSESTYKFCVTYKTATGFSSSDVTSRVLTSAYGINGSSSSSFTDTPSSYLYVSGSHKKGENCQTVKPYIYSGYDGYNSSSSSSLSDPAAKCDAQYEVDKNAKNYSACLAQTSNYGSGSSSGSTGSSNTDLYNKCDALYPSASQNTQYYTCIGNSSPATSGSLRRLN